MNCQETNYLLDATTEDMTREQRQAIDRHLASCPACSADWANWREIAALSIPPTPAALRGRIAAALPAQFATPARRAFRPFVVGGLLLAGVALAAAIALQFAERDLEPAPAIAKGSQAVVPVREVAGTATPAPSAAPQRPSKGSTIAATGDAVQQAVRNVLLNPHRILVLKRPEATADAPAIALAERCYYAVVGELRGLGGLEVVTDAATYTIASFSDRRSLPERDRRIARGLGAGKVLTISTEMGCDVTLYDSQTGAMDQGASGGGVDPQGDRAELFGKSMAHGVRDRTLTDGTTLFAEARATVLNTTLSEVERVTALLKPRSVSAPQDKALRSFFDKDVVAAAVQIVTKSPDARVRQVIWGTLRGVDDPALVQPLLQALATDPDASVRYQVAFALHTFLDQTGVLEALKRAAAEDPSREPEGTTAMTVREAALRASIPDQDFRNWVRSTLFDESLPARWRLLNLYGSKDGRFATPADLGRDAGEVVFDIGRREQNPQVRALAWNVLRLAAPDEARVPVLLGDLASRPDDEVRANAAWVLEQHMGKPEVRAAFERALDDSSLQVRRRVTSAIAEYGR